MGTIWFDTLGSAAVLNENLPKGLEPQSMMELGVSKWGKREIIFGDKKRPPSPLEDMLPYCGLDTAYAHMLYESHRLKLLDNVDLVNLYKKLLMPGLEAFLGMELNGIYVERENLERSEQEAEKKRKSLEIKLKDYVPVEFRETANFNSTPFLRSWLYGEKPYGLGLTPVKTTKKGLPSTDEASLLEQDHPAVHILLEWRALGKNLSFFAQWREWMDSDWRLHPQYNMFGTVTGRRSCSRPNLQQVSRDPSVRSCIGAPKGRVFLEVDFSQIEVRLAAEVSGDETLISIFQEKRDPYIIYAAFMLGKKETEVTKEERQKAKIAVLGFLYGMGAPKFVRYAKEQYGVDFTPEEAVEFREAYFDLFPGLKSYHEFSRKYANKRRMVQSMFGRIRHLPQILSRDQYVAGQAERQAINFPIQSVGGDITLSALIEIYAKIKEHKDEIIVVGDIHDALLFEINEDVWGNWAKMIMETMESPSLLKEFGVEISVPVVVEAKLGRTWGGGTEFTLEELNAGKEISVS